MVLYLSILGWISCDFTTQWDGKFFNWKVVAALWYITDNRFLYFVFNNVFFLSDAQISRPRGLICKC
jgi:hypothetical protein